jgi:hypothetical protein
MIRRFAFALVLTLVFFFSGTGLVRASSSTLPGDNLYGVKRTWEDVRLLFVFARAPMRWKAVRAGTTG